MTSAGKKMMLGTVAITGIKITVVKTTADFDSYDRMK